MAKKSQQNSNRLDIGIVMGSISDYPIIEEAEKIFQKLGITYRTTAASAHRTPDLVRKFISGCENDGAEVFIAAAGGAAALPGVVAAETLKPVMGVPITSVLNGLDSLLSIAQMPGGIPVACLAIGKAGAKNAALMAAQILAISRPEVLDALKKFRQDQRNQVIDDAKKLQNNA
jgi:5-(carboxyamino)imidazole ribonucleotide mutase